MNPRWMNALLAIAIVTALGFGLAVRGEAPDRTTPRDAEAPRTSAPPMAIAKVLARRDAPTSPFESAFFAEPGSRFRYRLDSRWKTTIREELGSQAPGMNWRVDEDIPNQIVIRVAGELDVQVVEKEDGIYVVRFELVRASGTQSNGTTRSEIDPSFLGGPGYARLTNQGRILGFAFDPEMSGGARELQASLFSMTHQFVMGVGDDWTESGLRDGTSMFTARFAWIEPRLLRSENRDVLRRTVVRYADDMQAARSDQAEASFADGWIGNVRVRADRIGELGALSARVRTDLTLERIETGAIPTEHTAHPAKEAFGFDLADPLEIDDALDVELPPFHGDPVARFRELTNEIDALVEAGTLDTHSGYDTWRSLSDLIRQRPDEALPLLDARVRSSDTAPATMHWLTSALGRAGNEGSTAATRALGDLISDDALPEDVRLAALIASHQVGAGASPELIDAVTDLLLRADLLPPDSPLPGAASLLIGTLAENGALPFEPTLFEMIRNDAFGRGEPGTYFDALANSGRVDVAAEIIPFLEDDDAEVREAAALALGDLDDPTALDALLRSARRTKSLDVARASLESLANFPPTPEATLTLAEIALTSENPSLRATALGSLGEHAAQGSRKAAETLALAAEADADPANQRLARRALEDLATPSDES